MGVATKKWDKQEKLTSGNKLDLVQGGHLQVNVVNVSTLRCWW